MILGRGLRNYLRELGANLLEPPTPNDKGNREVEYSFIASHLTKVSEDEGQRALDFGSGGSWMGLLTSRLGYKTAAIDLESWVFSFLHPNFDFSQSDLLQSPLPSNSFDLIINCSTIEHVGLIRYGNRLADLDGDLKAMKALRQALKPNGTMLLTTTVGKDKLVPSVHRIYGPERLVKLLEDWIIEKEEFWDKNSCNQWIQTTKELALQVEGNDHYYALALFVLR